MGKMGSAWKLAMLAGATSLGGFSVPAHAAPMTFDCDSFDGAYSEIVQTQVGPAYALKAEVSAKRLGRHREWRPKALLQVKSADGKNAIGVQFNISSYQNGTLSVALITIVGGEQKEYSVATLKLNEPLNTAIAVQDGKVRVDIGGEFAEAPITIGHGAEVRVGCSTGQFMFEKLEMASVG